MLLDLKDFKKFKVIAALGITVINWDLFNIFSNVSTIFLGILHWLFPVLPHLVSHFLYLVPEPHSPSLGETAGIRIPITYDSQFRV